VSPWTESVKMEPWANRAGSGPIQSWSKSFSYDGAGRVTQESYGANARENVSYQYDAISGVAGESQSYPGQLLSIQRGTGLTSLYRYDSLQRLTRRRLVQPGLGYDVTQSYRYDASGSVVSMDLPRGRESQVPRTSYQYDAFHRLSGIAFVSGSDSLALVRNVTYRANDLLSSLGLGGHLTLSRSYEAQRPLLTNLVTKQDTTTIYRQGYAYDDVGNIVGMQRFSGDSAGYDYDKLYQLRGVRYPKGNTDNRAANLSYGYDANGNRTSFGHDFTNKDRPEWLGYQPATGTSTGSNRLQQGWSGREGYTRYGYDFRGNLSSEKSFGDSSSLVSGSNAWKEETRTFNRRNELERLFHTTRQSGADSSVWAYEYDEKGMRVEKRRSSLPVTISGNDTAWSFDRKYAYDGVSAVADSSAGDTAWNYWVMMGLNRVAQVRRDGAKKWQVHYVVTDHLGTANLVTDSVGQVVQRNVLDPWGNLEMSSGTTPVAYLYTGKEWDPESGEYYFAARYYNPERGSFIGRDGKHQFYSPYEYVGNGPLLGSDPTGLWDWSAYWNNVGHNFLGAADAASLGIGPALRRSYFPDFENNIDYSSPMYKAGQLELFAFTLLMTKGSPIGASVSTRNCLSTGPNQAVFWSGVGRGGDKVAAAWTARNGGITLESTLEARGIQLPAWDANNSRVVAAWENASRQFAQGASGDVRVLQGESVSLTSVWKRIEFSALKANPNVTSITSVNPSTGEEALLWSR